MKDIKSKEYYLGKLDILYELEEDFSKYPHQYGEIILDYIKSKIYKYVDSVQDDLQYLEEVYLK